MSRASPWAASSSKPAKPIRATPHPNCEEVLYLLAGRVEHTLGDQSFTLETGDTLAIPAGVFHNGISLAPRTRI